MTQKPFATITSCERGLGGYVIRWRAPSAFLWQCVLARVKQLPDRYRYRLPDGTWWLDADALPWIRECIVNYDEALDGAWHKPERDASRPPASVVRAFTILHLHPSAPPDLVRAAHRVLKRRASVAVDVSPQRLAAWDDARRTALSWAEEHNAPTLAA